MVLLHPTHPDFIKKLDQVITFINACRDESELQTVLAAAVLQLRVRQEVLIKLIRRRADDNRNCAAR